jgi:hypothetical protein
MSRPPNALIRRVGPGSPVCGEKVQKKRFLRCGEREIVLGRGLERIGPARSRAAAHQCRRIVIVVEANSVADLVSTAYAPFCHTYQLLSIPNA